MAAASGTSTWSCLWKSTVSLQDAPCFSRGQTDELNGNNETIEKQKKEIDELNNKIS